MKVDYTRSNQYVPDEKAINGEHHSPKEPTETAWSDVYVRYRRQCKMVIFRANSISLLLQCCSGILVLAFCTVTSTIDVGKPPGMVLVEQVLHIHIIFHYICDGLFVSVLIRSTATRQQKQQFSLVANRLVARKAISLGLWNNVIGAIWGSSKLSTNYLQKIIDLLVSYHHAAVGRTSLWAWRLNIEYTKLQLVVVAYNYSVIVRL